MNTIKSKIFDGFSEISKILSPSTPFFTDTEVILQTGHGTLLTRPTSPGENNNQEQYTFRLGIKQLIILNIAAPGTCAWSTPDHYTTIVVPRIKELIERGTTPEEITSEIKKIDASKIYVANTNRSNDFDDPTSKKDALDTFHQGDNAFKIEVYNKNENVPNKYYTKDHRKGYEDNIYDYNINNLSTGENYDLSSHRNGIYRSVLINELIRNGTNKTIFLIDAGCSFFTDINNGEKIKSPRLRRRIARSYHNTNKRSVKSLRNVKIAHSKTKRIKRLIKQLINNTYKRKGGRLHKRTIKKRKRSRTRKVK
jgi:hypothetical protein